MIIVSGTQQSKLNSSLGSEKMDTKHKQHTKAHRKAKISQSGLSRPDTYQGVRADQVAESMYSGISKGVRTPSRGVRTDFSGLPPRLVGVRAPSRGVRTDCLLELEKKFEKFETFWLERTQFSPPHLNLTLSPM